MTAELIDVAATEFRIHCPHQGGGGDRVEVGGSVGGGDGEHGGE